jgi:hypothetical protein
MHKETNKFPDNTRFLKKGVYNPKAMEIPMAATNGK